MYVCAYMYVHVELQAHVGVYHSQDYYSKPQAAQDLR